MLRFDRQSHAAWLAMSLLTGCELVADLGSFEDAGATSATASSGSSSGGAGGAAQGGGATSSAGGGGGAGCPGSQQLCAGTCTETSDNPLHCGRCDHACASGTCTGQACDPVEIAVGGDEIQRLIHDATHLYWVTRTGSQRDVSRAAKPQGTPELIAPNVGILSHFLEDGTYLYFDSTTGYIRRMAKTGGNITNRLLDLGLTDLAAHGSELWSLQYNDPEGLYRGTTTWTFVEAISPFNGQLAIDDAWIYVLERASPYDVVRRTASQNPAGFQDFTDPTTDVAEGAVELHTDGHAAYWLVPGVGIRRRLAMGSTTPVEDVVMGDFSKMALDTEPDGYVYLLDGGGVFRAPKSGGSAELVANDPNHTVNGLVADANLVAWTSAGGRLLMTNVPP